MKMQTLAVCPLKVKNTQICAKKAVQKPQVCMPVLLASSINALSHPVGLIESQQVTTFSPYRLGAYTLQIGNLKMMFYPTIREL
jgi:hypothetical protein